MVSFLLKYGKKILFSALIVCSLNAYNQNKKDSIIFSNNLEFYDGIYISFDSIVKNRPIKLSSLIISEVQTEGKDFYSEIFEQNQIKYMSATGGLKTVSSADVWGFADHGRLHVRVKGQSVPLNIVGHICQFVMTVSYLNPYVNYGMNPYNPGFEQPYALKTTETKQFILNVSLNKYYEFTAESLLKHIRIDEELYNEYMNLKKRKKRKQKFYYLQKFNERNPLYIKM